jgi:hypothetical protein
VSEESLVRVVRLGEIAKHPNADTLGLTLVDGGYPCITKLGDFKAGDLAVYVPVDSLVPTDRAEFAFLAKDAKADGRARIKAKRLRGTFSMGLLVPCSGAWMPGDDVTAALGIVKYLPPGEDDHAARANKPRKSETAAYERRAVIIGAIASTLTGLVAGVANLPLLLLLIPVYVVYALWSIRQERRANKKPRVPYYDIEGLRKYGSELIVGEPVHISEKAHGSCYTAIHTGKRFFVRSRQVWRDRDDPTDQFWMLARKHDLERKLSAYPGYALFGEMYGSVQDLKYGVPPEEGVRFAAFDVLDTKTGEWLDPKRFELLMSYLGLPTVPTLYEGPWSPELVSLAEGKSTFPGADHVREGFVIRPMETRVSARLGGRLILKIHGEGYLARKEAT